MADKNVDKKELIIKTAMQLFADKGSTSTSMQEIAELCGMSKGSLYLVFKSKEDLERSIYIYCYRMIRDPLYREEVDGRGTPRDKFRNQIEILLKHVYELKEFLKRQLQEFAGSHKTDAPEWLCKSNAAPLVRAVQSKLETLYGKEVLPYTGDLILVMHGLLTSCIHALFHPATPIQPTQLANRCVELMDIIVPGLLGKHPKPLVSQDILTGWMEGSGAVSQKSPQQLIMEMRTRLGPSSSGVSPDRREEVLESLTILEEEMIVFQPRRAIILGMLSNLRNYPELAEPLGELQSLLSAYMGGLAEQKPN